MAKPATLDAVLLGTKRKGEQPKATKKTAARPAGPVKALTVKLSPELYRRLRLHAVDTDLSHQDIIVAALEKYIA